MEKDEEDQINNTLNSNMTLSNFTFVEEIKKGTIGNVLLYCSKSDQKLVAIKKIDISEFDENQIKDLKKEPTILQTVKHPNIVQYYGSFEEENNLYICMEYCSKKDLNEYIKNYKKNKDKISEDFIWKVAYQSLEALKYLHIEKKIIHKDIKPLNLLLDEQDNIKIGDFGSSGIMPILSKITTFLRVSSRMNNFGTTALFRAPEKNLSFKSDIWSLGVTLYYMAKLDYPFNGNSEDEIKENILNKVPLELDNTYSDSLNILIKKMLTKDPLKRPSAYECMDWIPGHIKQKYIKSINKNSDDVLIEIFFGPPKIKKFEDMPIRIKEKFNDLYLIASEFENKNSAKRNFICNECKKIPKININYIKLEVSLQCECGYFQILDIADFYRIFSGQRNKLKEDICSKCQKENEYPDMISYKFCNECEQVLCRKCTEEHEKNYPDHKLMGSLKEYYIRCKMHKKNLSHFCTDCFINLCEDCLNEHNKKNIGHVIKENKKIDDTIIKEAKNNMHSMKKSIMDLENYIKKKEIKNNLGKFKLLLKLNIVKLFLLYKSTFLNMYELNPTNYVTVNNFLDNNIKIQDVKLYEDKSTGVIYNIFTPLYNKSINGFDSLLIEKNILDALNEANNELIDLIDIGNNKFLAFSKFGFRIINDINILEYGKEERMQIDEVYKLKDGRFLISQSNKLKIFRYKESNLNLNNFVLEFTFPEFCQKKITSFLELTNGKLIVLSEGIITIFKKVGKNYKIYKNNFHLKEKIYSMIEFDDKTFITISEIKDEENCCHIEIWDSETFTLNFISPTHFYIPKHQYNMLKITNDLVIILEELENPFILNSKRNSILIFEVKRKVVLFDEDHLNYSRIIKISDGCFIGISKLEDIPCIQQYEIIKKDNTLKFSLIGFKEFKFDKNNDVGDIINVLIYEEKLIAFKKNGKIIIFK